MCEGRPYQRFEAANRNIQKIFIYLTNTLLMSTTYFNNILG